MCVCVCVRRIINGCLVCNVFLNAIELVLAHRNT